MEQLSISDHFARAQNNGPHYDPYGPPTQLPPQMLTTAAQLLDLTDKKVMVSLRDGRKLIGALRTWDQFGNIVLQNTVERLFAKQTFADVDRGLFLIRGENVLLMGEIDLDKEDDVPDGFTHGSPEDVFELHKQEQANKRRHEKNKAKRMQRLGFESESLAEGAI